MKYLILLVDGMADSPLADLDGRTPLEAARTPNLDALCRDGRVGRIRTLPEGYPASTDVAGLVALGYNPKGAYTGRGPLEALGLGLSLRPDQVAFRSSLVTVDGDALVDCSAGHVRTSEAGVLINLLNESAQEAALPVRFHQGVGHRGVMVCSLEDADQMQCTPPPEVLGKSLTAHLPRGSGSEVVIEVMQRSRDLFLGHDINKVRLDLGENAASMVWLWSPGTSPSLEPFSDRFGVTGAAATSIAHMRGICRAIGLDLMDVPEATSEVDADYPSSGRIGAAALADHDLVLVHLDTPNAASLDGDTRRKVQCIEQIDRQVVPPLVEAGQHTGDWRMLVLPTLHTSTEHRTHSRDCVPFLMTGTRVDALRHPAFTEAAAEGSDMYVTAGHELLPHFLRP